MNEADKPPIPSAPSRASSYPDSNSGVAVVTSPRGEAGPVSIVSVALLPIPFVGAMLSIVLHLGAFLGFFILWLMLMYKAYNRERWVLPFIGPLAEKQA